MKQRIVFVMCLCFLLINGVFAQTKSLKGTVKDKLGESIIGASVLIEGTSQGTITDLDGNYVIENIPAGKNVLVVSYVGYQTQKLEIDGRNVINVILQEDTEVLDEVVVVGYGVQRKTDVTSAVAKIKKEDFSSVVTTSSPLQMVQGKIPGLAMSRSGGSDPNAEMSLQIRGMSTLNAGSSPLIIIDGIPGGNLNSISPNDIESIDVLRDGSAAAIYGSRGTSGVIIVTTKKGKYDSKIKMEYEGTVSFDQMYNSWELLSADDYRSIKDKFANSGNKAQEAIAQRMHDYGGNVNAIDAVTQNTANHQHYFSLTGGSKNANVSASLNYRNNEGIIRNTGQKVLSGRIASEFKHFDDKLKVNLNLSYSEKEAKSLYKRYGNEQIVLGQAFIWNPTNPLFQEDGSYTPSPDIRNFLNPMTLTNETDNITKYTNILASAKVSYRLLPELNLSAMFSLDKQMANSGLYMATDNDLSKAESYNGYAERGENEDKNETLELTATYNKEWTDLLNLEILGGYSYQKFLNESFSMTNRNFTFDSNSFNNIGAGAGLKEGTGTMASYKGESKLISFFGRAVLNFKNRYLFNVTVRHEGSSRFGKQHQWGTFPSASLAWRIIEEPFMKQQKVFDDLKLRLGYGVTGNMIDVNYVNYVLYTIQDGYTYMNGGWQSTYAPKTNANPDLKWETKREWNVGVDMSFLDNRLSANVDLYWRKSVDLLYQYQVPVPPYLSDMMWGNIGTISNKGIEVNINATPIKTKDFIWNINVNGSYNKNNVDKLTVGTDVQRRYEYDFMGDLFGTLAFMTEEGRPLGNFYGWKFAGVNENGETLVYKLDENKNIAIDADGKPMKIPFQDTKGSEDNRTVIGNGMPKYYVNMGNSLKYKNFDLSFLFRGVFGFDILNEADVKFGTLSFNSNDNALKSAMNNPSLDGPSYTDRNVYKGNFVKLDNVTLGYNVPLKKNKFVEALRVHAAVQNVCTFTKYPGCNPELEINGTMQGIEKYYSYPLARTYSLGVNLTF